MTCFSSCSLFFFFSSCTWFYCQVLCCCLLFTVFVLCYLYSYFCFFTLFLLFWFRLYLVWFCLVLFDFAKTHIKSYINWELLFCKFVVAMIGNGQQCSIVVFFFSSQRLFVCFILFVCQGFLLYENIERDVILQQQETYFCNS